MLAQTGAVREAGLAEMNARMGVALQLDRLYQTDLALAQLDAVIAAKPAVPAGILAKATEQRRLARQRLDDTAYRLSIEGWRAFERGDLSQAVRALTTSLSQRPGEPVTRYRLARVLIAQANEGEALQILEDIIRERSRTPPTFLADACVEAARIHAQRGDRGRAIALYGTAGTVFGADERTKAMARREAARLTSR